MSKQSRAGEALGDRPLRCRYLVDSPAAPAPIARPADADHTQARRNMVKHLADGLTDQMEAATAAEAGLVIEIEPNILAF